jgi:hypothetical protein
MTRLLNAKWRGRYERQNGWLFCFVLYNSLFLVWGTNFETGVFSLHLNGILFEQMGSVSRSKMLGGFYLAVGFFASEIISGLLNSYRYRLVRRYPSGSEAFFDACLNAAMLAITTVLYYIAGGFKYVVFPEYLFVLIFPAYLLGKNIWWWHRAR